MQTFQQQFIEFAIQNEALRFGRFTLKSGRTSPYFFNSGQFDSGARLARLGEFYAEAAIHSGIRFDMLFGPAYKGIPLVTATAIALARTAGRDLPYAFNRKEAKDHGEKGCIVGAPLEGAVLIVDDVISAGTSIRESAALIRAAGARPAGVIVSLDRQERGTENTSAVEELERELAIPVSAIVDLDILMEYLAMTPALQQWQRQVDAYRQRWGASSRTPSR